MSDHASEHALSNMFVAFGVLGIVGALVLVILANVGYPTWNTGIAVEPDSLLVGALYGVMGVGFATFGLLLRVESWEGNEA